MGRSRIQGEHWRATRAAGKLRNKQSFQAAKDKQLNKGTTEYTIEYAINNKPRTCIGTGFICVLGMSNIWTYLDVCNYL